MLLIEMLTTVFSHLLHQMAKQEMSRKCDKLSSNEKIKYFKLSVNIIELSLANTLSKAGRFPGNTAGDPWTKPKRTPLYIIPVIVARGVI
jgi:hypothetical protein